MPRPLYAKFVDKARSALTAEIEIYSKQYREETFAVFATNAPFGATNIVIDREIHPMPVGVLRGVATA